MAAQRRRRAPPRPRSSHRSPGGIRPRCRRRSSRRAFRHWRARASSGCAPMSILPNRHHRSARPTSAKSMPARTDTTGWSTRGTGGSIAAAAAERRDGTRLERIAAYVAGKDDGVLERATAELRRATDAGFDVLLDEQRRAWAERWERADVRIEGDDELQHAVRVSLFHLMAAAGDRGEAPVGARGLTGRAYRGHVFWDADLFVLPFLAATHPQSARAMLEYRIARLPQALARAAAEGRAGARFPWESADDGTEVTPHAGSRSERPPGADSHGRQRNPHRRRRRVGRAATTQSGPATRSSSPARGFSSSSRRRATGRRASGSTRTDTRTSTA